MKVLKRIYDTTFFLLYQLFQAIASKGRGNFHVLSSAILVVFLATNVVCLAELLAKGRFNKPELLLMGLVVGFILNYNRYIKRDNYLILIKNKPTLTVVYDIAPEHHFKTQDDDFQISHRQQSYSRAGYVSCPF